MALGISGVTVGIEQGSEPTGWELMRGIARIEQAMRDNASTYLPITLFISEKKQITDRLDNLGREVGGLRSSQHESAKQSNANEQRLDDQRGRNRLMLYGLIAAPLISGVIVWIIGGGLTPLP